MSLSPVTTFRAQGIWKFIGCDPEYLKLLCMELEKEPEYRFTSLVELSQFDCGISFTVRLNHEQGKAQNKVLNDWANAQQVILKELLGPKFGGRKSLGIELWSSDQNA